MLGVSISPPQGSMAENPTASSTMYTTLGAPWGANGWRYGAQAGTESRRSTLITPSNDLPMASTPLAVTLARVHRTAPAGRGHPPDGMNGTPPRRYVPSRPISWSRWTAWLREDAPSLR